VAPTVAYLLTYQTRETLLYRRFVDHPFQTVNLSTDLAQSGVVVKSQSFVPLVFQLFYLGSDCGFIQAHDFMVFMGNIE
jgi:hypothetical protein